MRGIEVQLDNMEQDLSVLTTEIRDRINQMTQEVELKVIRHFLLILPRAMCKGFLQNFNINLWKLLFVGCSSVRRRSEAAFEFSRRIRETVPP